MLLRIYKHKKFQVSQVDDHVLTNMFNHKDLAKDDMGQIFSQTCCEHKLIFH